MIPKKLELKNFLSYGPQLQTIDFGHYPLICLSGKNGHGKSALLDAMTWAVWGQARKTSGVAKADANLLHLGQTQMMVCFEFEFNNEIYRIKREYAKTYGKPLATVEFGIVDGATNQYRSLTDKTIRATQAKIEETIGLNYDAFINSAFLKQGQSNEFSKKSPKERKEIIGHILGLDQFDNLRKKAMETARNLGVKKTVQAQQHETILKELEKKPELLNRLTLTDEELKKVNAAGQAINERHKALSLEKSAFAKKEQEAALLQQQHQALTKQKNEYESELKQLITDWRATHKMLRTISDKKLIEKQLNELSSRLEDHQKRLSQQFTFKELLLKLREQEQLITLEIKETYQKKVHAIEAEKHGIEQEKIAVVSTCQTILKQVKENSGSLKELNETISKKEAELPKESVSPETFAKNELRFEKRKNQYHTWVNQANTLQKELSQLGHKMNFTMDASQPSCPLCEQNLSVSRKKFLQTKFNEEQRTLHHTLKRFKRIIPALKETLVAEHESIKAAKKFADQHSLTSAALKLLTEQKNKAAELDGRLEKEQAELLKKVNEFERKLKKVDVKLLTLKKEAASAQEKHEGYQKLLLEKKQLEENLIKNNYLEAEHKKDQAAAAQLKEQLQKAGKEDEARSEQAQRIKEINQLSTKRRTLKKEETSVHEKQKPYNGLKDERALIEEKETTLKTACDELIAQKEKLLQEKGRIEADQANLKKLEEHAASFIIESKKLSLEIEEYDVISQALGKEGIQALLIEQALPEIENEANALLSQLTDNQSHIIIDSLRDLKKGGSKETLDIKISDASGIRPYELFSGGEAFRIDFALRIAISKLLARRAGTSLQTLIIDEGFGSQDEDGLNNIMEVIHKIQDSFCKVIIVSHLASMKEQFPVHFYVEKLAQGSAVTIIEQG